MSDIRPFKIDIPESQLDDLRARLTNTRWPEAELVDDWTQGAPLIYVTELADYWLNSYDWRATEASLNRFDQFKTELSGLDIHFIHQRSSHDDALPLIITHGWPGSIAEFNKVIEPLTEPTKHGGKAEDAFHVVCPSLPGFGFSDKPTTTGWGTQKIAAVWDDLMKRLGYDKYMAQGGDWGSVVTTEIGRLVGGCIGIHTNMPVARPNADDMAAPAPDEVKALQALGFYQEWDSGYSKQQATRPQTLGYGLVDSPVGQMAWIMEKFYFWTDNDGSNPETAVTKDEILDEVMLYWLPGTAASSGRLYWESFGKDRGSGRIELPTGVAAFPEEILPAARAWAERVYNVTHWTDMPKGGHFAALEQPELYVNDVATFASSLR
jgi:pimeloyl-ACP methyl ester carboxylesterase